MLRSLNWMYAALTMSLMINGHCQQAQDPAGNTPAAQPAATRPTGGGGNADGLDYYRRNPQLAQRYFPAGVPGSPAAEAEAEPRFSIKFEGGSPDQLVRALRQAVTTTTKNAPGPNVMIANAMRDVQIPPFALQNVTVSDVFQALNNVADSAKSGQWSLSGSTQPIWVLNPANSFGSSVDPLTGQPLGMGGRAREPRTVQVFPVSRYLAELKIDDLTTAIQTAWNLLPSVRDEGGTPPTLKFHKDTELLIAVGTDDQLRLAKEVLTSLSQGRAEKMEMERITAGENPSKKEDAKKF